MNNEESTKLLIITQQAFPHQAVAEGTAAVWFGVLQSVPFKDGEQALINIIKRGAAFCTIGELYAEVKRIRAARIARFKMPDPPAELDSADQAAWLAEAVKRVGDGEVTRPAQLGITARPSAPRPKELSARALEDLTKRVPEDNEPAPEPKKRATLRPRLKPPETDAE